MAESFIYLFWILLGFCCVLIGIGIFFLVVGRKHKFGSLPERAKIGADVHRRDGVSSGLEKAIEKKGGSGYVSLGMEENEKVGNISSGIQDFSRQALDSGYREEVEDASPVPPYTSWDNMSERSSEFSRGKNAEPIRIQEKENSDQTGVKEMGKEAFVPEKEVQAGGKDEGLVFDLDQRLLLLKSHELLLTLTDGLKKLSVAKTEAVKKEKINEMLAALKLLDAKSEWGEYRNCFDKVNPDFWTRIESRSSEEMSPYELRLCALLSMGMGTKEIADLTNRSVRTVETTIYKIRKKLGMEAEDKTQDYLKKVLQERE